MTRLVEKSITVTVLAVLFATYANGSARLRCGTSTTNDAVGKTAQHQLVLHREQPLPMHPKRHHSSRGKMNRTSQLPEYAMRIADTLPDGVSRSRAGTIAARDSSRSEKRPSLSRKKLRGLRPRSRQELQGLRTAEYSETACERDDNPDQRRPDSIRRRWRRIYCPAHWLLEPRGVR